MRTSSRQSGLTLLEILVFIVVVSIALGALLSTLSQSVGHSADPIARIKALEKAQALMDEIIVRKFDENTPTGGIPACNAVGGNVCAGIVSDTDFDDVGDYNGYIDASDIAFPISVVVVEAGLELLLPTNSQAKRITITASAPNLGEVILSSYKVNF